MSSKVYIRVKDISDIKKVLNNHVLVRTHSKNVDKRTESGIYHIAPSETDWRPADHMDRMSEVVLVPDRLNYSDNPKYLGSMPWDTDMMLQPGDIVWHDFMNANNCPVVESDNQPDQEFKILNYFDIYMSKRVDNYIMLNGYMLLEEVCEKRKYESDLLDPKVDKRFAKVYLAGEPNREYRANVTDECVDVAPGDVIVKRKPEIHLYLESPDHCYFNGDDIYIILQRKDVYAILENYEAETANDYYRRTQRRPTA